jgi:hypothetical protein
VVLRDRVDGCSFKAKAVAGDARIFRVLVGHLEGFLCSSSFDLCNYMQTCTFVTVVPPWQWKDMAVDTLDCTLISEFVRSQDNAIACGLNADYAYPFCNMDDVVLCV